MDFEKEILAESAAISGEIILESFGQLLEYYPLVLGALLNKTSILLGQPIHVILDQLEEELGITGRFESITKKLSASREVLGSFLGEFFEE